MKRLIADGLSAEAARATLGGAAIPDAELGSIADDLAGELRDALDRFDEVGTNEVLDRLLAALSVETVLRTCCCRTSGSWATGGRAARRRSRRSISRRR